MTLQVYTLVSPHMQDGVKGVSGIAELQAQLAAGPFFPQGMTATNPADADGVGVYGPATAAAVHLVKFWMGYPAGHTVGNAGLMFQQLLNGTRKRNPVMIALRGFRIRRRNLALSPKNKALRLAQSQVGTKEWPANSNRVKYSVWYGMIGSWCAMFQTWVGASSGEPWAARGSRFAYVPYMDNAAAEHKYGMSFTSNPEPGDLVTYDWPGESPGVSDHVGRFEKWVTPGHSFTAIEGNTSISSQSNGGEVMRRTRTVDLVHHFIHLAE